MDQNNMIYTTATDGQKNERKGIQSILANYINMGYKHDAQLV